MTSPTRTAAMRTLRIIVVHNLVRAADEDDAALRAQAARAHALHLGLVEAGYDIASPRCRPTCTCPSRSPSCNQT